MLLVILTAADIRAVGPGVWTGWKGQLLRQLYYETEPLLTGGHTSVPRETRIRAAIERIPQGGRAIGRRRRSRRSSPASTAPIGCGRISRSSSIHASLMRRAKDQTAAVRLRDHHRQLHRA